MQCEVSHDGFRRDNFNGVYCYSGQQCSVSIRHVLRCTGMDGFLMLNVGLSCQPHAVWMQELEVG